MAAGPDDAWAVGYSYKPSVFANQTMTLRTTGD
jgi:hypothetical protein